METIQAITIDFWNTLVDSSNGALRRQARNSAMQEVFSALDREWDEEAVTEAFRVSYVAFERLWYGEQRTMSASECVQVLWDHLDLEVPKAMHDDVVRKVELSILDGMPALLPGVTDALPRLAETCKIALISDTAMSPGSVLRSVLERHAIAGYFDAMVFSDETGVSKPHPKAFNTALSLLGVEPANAVHIGDIERTDIAGAAALGMRAILFRGDETGRYHREQEAGRTAANATAHSWADVLSILEEWMAQSQGGEDALKGNA